MTGFDHKMENVFVGVLMQRNRNFEMQRAETLELATAEKHAIFCNAKSGFQRFLALHRDRYRHGWRCRILCAPPLLHYSINPLIH
jgi:hypothetical protein